MRNTIPVLNDEVKHRVARLGGRQTKLLPAEAGRLKDFVSYGLKSFAHDGVI